MTMSPFAGEGMRKRHVLKAIAVPSQNLPKTPRHGSLRSPIKRQRRNAVRRNIFDVEQQEDSKDSEDIENVNEKEENSEELSECLNIINSYIKSTVTVPDNSTVINLDPTGHLHHEDKGVQVSEPFISMINAEKKLNTMTGLQSFKMLDSLVECAGYFKPDEDLKYCKLNMRERIILTFMKLKQNVSFLMLSYLFGNITGTSCKTIFIDTIIILSRIFSVTIPWPSRTATRNLLPLCFQDFKNVRIVLDCTEITAQRPKCLQCRIKIYSQYKSNLTIKFMTGVSPDGQITYVSKAYGGRASDKAIFGQSKLVEKLEPNIDEVMVDKGFLIDQVCAAHKITVVRPPHLRKAPQFSKEDAITTKNIAKARVHVERANQRIKIFKIFSGKIDWTLLPVIEDCFRVVCGVVNISTPILSDKRF